MLPDDYAPMTHRYVNKLDFDAQVQKHKGVYKYNLHAKEKHGELYLGTLGGLDYLNEELRGK